ncbi:MAG: hypothetical protein KGD73_07155 [Candidatus Lokiarchaeota archaeon]|nr:hypothetical protein [Candidatus Lokiarchaeota archaeon]
MNMKERYKKIKSVFKKLFEPTENKKPAEITDQAVLDVINSNWTRWN